MPEPSAPSASAAGRVFRVFISSTFRDMQEERDELVKRVFPRLRKLCEERRVAWSEVDLRWGITDEQKAEGKVLPVCLKEIHRCRPYFIGLLGERYGSVPASLPPGLVDREPWLSGHAGRSVTELEILHGVLNDPTMAVCAFFYFRDPAYVQALPASVRSRFLERPDEAEVRQRGAPEAEARALKRRQRLSQLKAAVRASGLPLTDNYPDPRALGEFVYRDLASVLDRRFPKDQIPDRLVREAAEHDSVAEAQTRSFVGREDLVRRLTRLALGEGIGYGVLVDGEPGSGKTSVLAQCYRELRENLPDACVIAHFIGPTGSGGDWKAMAARIIGELGRRFGIQGEIPTSPDGLRHELANRLSMASVKEPVAILLDGLDQLDEGEGGPDLVWLPPILPDRVQLIASAGPGRARDEWLKRGWPTIGIEPLDASERAQLVHVYLDAFGKSFSAALESRLLQHPPAAQPLYLRLVLDELRVWGEHETLAQALEHYLEAPSAEDLFVRVLERLERDHDPDRPGLVRDAMTALWSSRRGLSEVELLDILGDSNGPMPGAYWSPLALATEGFLAVHSCVVGLYHQSLREAVERRYLPTPELQKASHGRMAAYFGTLGTSRRAVEERHWHLAQAEDWSGLAAQLMDAGFLRMIAGLDDLDLSMSAGAIFGHWAAIEAHSPLRLLDELQPVLQDAENAGDELFMHAMMLIAKGLTGDALRAMRVLAEKYRSEGRRRELMRAVSVIAGLEFPRGELEAALRTVEEWELMAGELDNRSQRLGARVTRATILTMLDRTGEAKVLLNETREEALASQDVNLKLGFYEAQGMVHYKAGWVREWVECLDEQIRLSRETGHLINLPRLLLNKAADCINTQRGPEALRWTGEAEAACRSLGLNLMLATVLQNKATCLAFGDEFLNPIEEDLPGAVRAVDEGEAILRAADSPRDLAVFCVDMSRVLRIAGHLDRALKMAKEGEDRSRALGDRAHVARALTWRAQMLLELGRKEEAWPLLQEAKPIIIENPDGSIWNDAGHEAQALFAEHFPDEDQNWD